MRGCISCWRTRNSFARTRKTYFVEAGQELLLQAAPDPESEMHYWFADGAFLGGCAAGQQSFFAPQNGKIEVGMHG